DLDFFRALEPLFRQVDSKRMGQACLSRRGQPQRAAVALADEPTQIQAAPPDLRAHKTRDMISALAPVETRPAEDSFAARAQVRTEFGQKARARIRHLAAVLGKDDVPIRDERVGDGDADLAGQVIVAGAGWRSDARRGRDKQVRCRSTPDRPSGQPEWSRARYRPRARRLRPDLQPRPWGTLPPRRPRQQATTVRRAPNQWETTEDGFA